MRWLKRKNKPLPAATAGQAEAAKALGKAEAGLERAHKDEREIMAAAAKLRRLGQDNDFAARIREALGGSA